MAMKFVGFQGLVGWVALGCAQAALLFFVAYFAHHVGFLGVSQHMLDKINLTLLPKVGTAVSLFSLLATYNMLVVCKLPYIDHALGKANLKFTGTKLLLVL